MGGSGRIEDEMVAGWHAADCRDMSLSSSGVGDCGGLVYVAERGRQHD